MKEFLTRIRKICIWAKCALVVVYVITDLQTNPKIFASGMPHAKHPGFHIFWLPISSRVSGWQYHCFAFYNCAIPYLSVKINSMFSYRVIITLDEVVKWRLESAVGNCSFFNSFWRASLSNGAQSYNLPHQSPAKFSSRMFKMRAIFSPSILAVVVKTFLLLQTTHSEETDFKE